MRAHAARCLRRWGSVAAAVSALGCHPRASTVLVPTLAVTTSVVASVGAGVPESSAEVEVDLCDDWAPRVLSPPGQDPPAYRAVFVALANERLEAPGVPPVARRDRAFELYGIPPSPSVLRARLADAERHACHDEVDDAALDDLTEDLRRDDKTRSRARTPERKAAVRAVEAHLHCEGLLPARAASDGVFDGPTRGAVQAYQRRHALLGDGDVDAATRQAMRTDSRELEVLAALRMLRERVADATGLIADGSASQTWGTVLGRSLDAAELRDSGGHAPMSNGAPDRISNATDAAARALGWRDAASIEASLADLQGDCRVSVPVENRPAWRDRPHAFRVEIDRGDMWIHRPKDGADRDGEAAVLTLVVAYDGIEEGLVRWPTTIGGWERKRLDDGNVVRRFQESPVGPVVWRDIVAAPTWYPPASTPDDELVIPRGDGHFSIRNDTIGPGYRSAYGLAMLPHLERLPGQGKTPDRFTDRGIRTHGTSSYRSMYGGGNSHGCHRLPNHLVLRLTSFLLREQPHDVVGPVHEPYARALFGGKAWIHREDRGYVYRLRTPIEVEVLEGRVHR